MARPRPVSRGPAPARVSPADRADGVGRTGV